MCNICGYPICQCNQTYNYNWYNTDGLPCTTCSGTIVCKKKVPAKCTIYNGVNLDAIGESTNTDLETIIAAINAELNDLQANQQAQDIKNAAILVILNDINDRLNVIDSGSHVAYTL